MPPGEYSQRDLDITAQLVTITVRMDTLISLAASHTADLGDLRRQVSAMETRLSETNEWFEGFEATMLEEVRQLHETDNEIRKDLAVLRESTDTRFGQLANEDALIKREIQAAIVHSDAFAVPRSWFKRSWKVIAVVGGLILANTPNWLDLAHKQGFLK